MRPRIVIRKTIIALAVAAMLIIPTLITAIEAQQLSGSQLLQAPAGISPSTQKIAPGEPHLTPVALPPPGKCPYGFYLDPITRQCMPEPPFPPGEPRLCPDRYYWDQLRQQCMPEIPRPLVD